MKTYVMLSYITGSGGVQCYVAAKAKYLEEHDWKVVVISGNHPRFNDKCLIPYLDKYIPNGNPYQDLHACYIPRFMVKKAISRYLEVIGPIEKDDEIIVESWNSPTAIWGELIAARLHARHIFWTANEHFRKYGERVEMYYEEKIDFYMFKMERGEIFTTVDAANRLFTGYKTYKKGDFVESINTEDPIQDISIPIVDSITKSDWNICYIGRSNKPYVPNIFKDVGLFAQKHPEKNIQFLVVGEVDANKGSLQPLKEINNLKIVELGDLYPLPRSLYSKVDVVIAGSGSARHSMDEDVLVIMADSLMKNSHGLLGYDTMESVQKEEGSPDMTFEKALERALVEETWKCLKNRWKKSPGIKECSQRQFEIIANADPVLAYYDEQKLLEGRILFYPMFVRLVLYLQRRAFSILKR